MTKNLHKEGIVNLFWTGGWDSTFRLLCLLLLEKKRVQPYYILDFKRESLHAELKTKHEICTILNSEYPYTKELLLPTVFAKLGDIKEDPEITNAFQIAIKTTHFGSQYEWLARFCKQNNIYDMELCSQRSENPNWEPRLSRFLKKVGDSEMYVFDEKYSNSYEYAIFKFYHFPIRKYSKQDMLKISQKNGWENIMNRTWFYHHPNLGNTPCGKCTPCQQTISEYLEFRIPANTGFISRFQETKWYILLRRVNNYLKNLVSIIKFTKLRPFNQ